MARRPPRKQIKRRGPKRESYDRVLIVCEGTRTEPMYFGDIVAHYRLSTANIVIVGSGADPRTVVQKAKKRRSRENRQGEKYDRVYCVFDRDEHATFDQACEEAESSGVEVARSWPCFEFWLLLHFGFTRKPYARSGGKSAGQHCVEELRRWLPGYKKGTPGLFSQLTERLESAMVHAARTLAAAEADGESNPSTEIHKLIDYLQSLKSTDGEPV